MGLDRPDIRPRVDADLLAAWVTGVTATVVAIGGLYLVPHLRAATAIAVVVAGVLSIRLAVSGLAVVGLEARSRTI
jgi:hypothetical protein